MYAFDCTFCDELVQTQSVDTIKSRGKTHLTENHADDVLGVLGDRYDEIPCHNECGYVVAIDGADGAARECPNCGYDNFSSLVERYVYWRIAEQ